MISPDSILKTMRLTEKSNRASAEFGQYTLEVYSDSNKNTVREAVERTFGVSVTRVNIMNIKGKMTRSRRGGVGYKPGIKKAIVTLKEGDKIEVL